MLRILESQAPTKQTATDTISTLSSRLQTATLLEDRRAAILGLRSFAKLYPASVASGALRELISSLRKDGEDADTIKVVLETLLMLFAPDESSPEASEEISLWLADEFTQRQDNITVLLDLLESRDFYSRLYSLQLTSYISSARPERTQECIFSAPLGVSRLVATLDDSRDAVRNEALVLLVALTPSSTDLQKVVAFENAFDRVFNIIETEGGLTLGSTVVQDCLSLLANLLKLNETNQSVFRESGCVAKLERLLAEASNEEESDEGVADWSKPQRDMNLWGILAVLQLFLIQGSKGTPVNQTTFWQRGVVQQVLRLAFNHKLAADIRSKCLNTCADLVHGNHALQEKFGDLSVPKSNATGDARLANGHPTPNGIQSQNVIEAMLRTSLEPAPSSHLNVRLGASECVKAFFAGHSGIRTHVLRRAIDGYKNGDDDVPNLLLVLLGQGNDPGSDPYRQWIAATLLFHLLYDNPEAKSMAIGISEGDAESGEEVVTCIQLLAGTLMTCIQRNKDTRISVAYLMLLAGWLFEDPDAVNDLLGEASSVQGLINAAKHASNSAPLASGLSVFLLGIVYEFSSKDSPVPRKTLHGLLVERLGRDQYIDKLNRLRENPLVRDFEVLSPLSEPDPEGGLPEVYFDQIFIDFFRDNFRRIIRAIDRDPGIEISVISNGVEKGISRELVDSLRAENEDLSQSKRKLEEASLLSARKLEQAELDLKKTRESWTVDAGRIKQINESLQRNHEEELQQLRQEIQNLNKQHEGQLQGMQAQHEGDLQTREEQSASSRNELLRQHQEQLNSIDLELKQWKNENDRKAAKTRERYEAEIADLKATNDGLSTQLEKANKDHIMDLQTAHDEYNSRESTLTARAKRAEEKAEEAEERFRACQSDINALESNKQELEQARKDVQTELDDLLIVFGDLEAKRSKDKKALKALGAEVSEGEDEDDDQGGADSDEAEGSDVD
ncbi:MAG: hypothetical protein Q9227_001785 [Pyrenula ochraceoflavens]